jgi:hypothetical protein
MFGMAMRTSVSSVANIIIWVPGMSGSSLTHTGWIVFTAGKEVIPIGEATPSATIITVEIAMDTFNRGMTGTGIDQRKNKISLST